MNNKLTYYLLILGAFVFNSCLTNNQNKKDTASDTTSNITKIEVDSLQSNNIQIKETFNQEDLPVNEYLTERLKPIRENFKRINSISKWTSINTKDLWESTEGGEAKFYNHNGQLEKIVTGHFGETFQQLTEYYLTNGQLSFVFEQLYKYNRPMYYDTTAMKEMNDTEAFDIEKTEIVEERSYFENGKLFHQLNNSNSESPLADNYFLEEQKRLKTDFEKLIKFEAKK